jgi:hypothetical protein
VDLLGSSFSVDSQGDISIYSHLVSYSIEPDERAFRFTADLSYNILKNDKLDYRTYTLVFGFPRRETLQISSLNLDVVKFLNIHLKWDAALSKSIHTELHFQQIIPLQFRKKIKNPSSGDGSRSDTRSYGGGRISFHLKYFF